MKCEGYRMTPVTEEGYFSVDGERLPFEPCEVRVQGVACHFLSPTGKFVNDFSGKPHKVGMNEDTPLLS
jgi:sphingosine kinase